MGILPQESGEGGGGRLQVYIVTLDLERLKLVVRSIRFLWLKQA